MMLDPYAPFIARDRRARLLREAENQRLANTRRPRRAAVHLRLLAGIGEWMIVSGSRLKARHQLAVEASRFAT